MKLTAVARSHKGYLRERNEDSHLIMNAGEALLALVADGMGGSPGGDVASALACDVFSENMDQLIATPQGDLETRLQDLVLKAHDRLITTGQTRPDLSGMGTTLSAVFVSHAVVWYAHCGDSRIYLQRDRMLRQITKDHNVPGSSHMLSKVIGGQGAADDPETGMLELEEGEKLLLCTDGLTNMVSDQEIAAILGNLETPDEQVDKLIARALEEGGKDNITALIIR